MSTADAMEDAQGLEKLIFISSLLVASAIAGLLAWRTTIAISRPIETITHTAQQAAQKADYTLRIPITTNDEIGLLSQALNQLITQVAEHTQAQQPQPTPQTNRQRI